MVLPKIESFPNHLPSLLADNHKRGEKEIDDILSNMFQKGSQLCNLHSEDNLATNIILVDGVILTVDDEVQVRDSPTYTILAQLENTRTSHCGGLIFYGVTRLAIHTRTIQIRSCQTI